ncbi:HAMP domain-containing sensor histidine kinase [Flavobacterium sp.]|jgi:two-component system, sporulation sensor kinase D|uniref:sensor histidine kinase n=1 Tax=Flavobacterium sp. TaxID=239 RepID=UPI0022BC2414|nr:HAMP domain-containing sensor histidine kinase [Flavobacterium sp.]MCZ8145544.1 HAMP domain-containing sensor histidine kinase [Flavobacterium sp.]MCZ8368313.1 HAMP domain-containing sensor histidine kinase [Flavobacterium sp.]
MQFSDRRAVTRWIIIATSFVIVSLILWNTYAFFQIFKEEERVKMQQWALAQKTLANADIDTDITLPFEIIQNAHIPIIVTQQGKIVNHINIDPALEKDPLQMQAMLENLKSQNDPIKMEYVPGKFQYLYYGDSDLLNKLKYYPAALLLIIFLFAAVVYNFYRSTKMATQNKLWAGMAKETAHQIGTPLSSLIGWLEYLKAEGTVAASTLVEIEKDIVRLQVITDRFSKVGSEPVLETLDLVAETRASFDYLQARFSNQVQFTFTAPEGPLWVAINPALHSWTIENLMKNAIDAMRGKGTLEVAIENDGTHYKINVTDNGKGIPKNQFRKVFEPGFTTKKRGWGLGLSLTKRIVEDYHKGKIRVLHSEIGKGTTMQVVYGVAPLG